MTNDRIPILLGAEGVAEAEAAGATWLLRPGEGDLDAFLSFHGLTLREYNAATQDRTGRPYWLRVLSREAPTGIRERAREHARLVRLEA